LDALPGPVKGMPPELGLSVMARALDPRHRRGASGQSAGKSPSLPIPVSRRPASAPRRSPLAGSSPSRR